MDSLSVLLKFAILLVLPFLEVKGENVTLTSTTTSATTETAAATATTTTSEILQRMDGRIVNGEKAAQGQFPFVVSIQKAHASDGHFCGGTLITDKWIVTAAHCLQRRSGSPNLLAVAGDTNLKISYSPLRQTRLVKMQILNPLYNYASLYNDVALLLVDSPFLITEYVSPIPLRKYPPKSNTMCTVIGWGYPSEYNKTISDYLMYVKLPLVQPKQCQELLADIITVTTGILCAGYMKGGKDACQGDSGGPLICDDTLTGVVSGGRGCARPMLPGFYTNVPEYREWIEQVLNSNGKNQSFAGITKHPSGSTNGSITIYFINSHVIFYSLFIIMFVGT